MVWQVKWNRGMAFNCEEHKQAIAVQGGQTAAGGIGRSFRIANTVQAGTTPLI
jgi:hypothetical protein